MRSYKESSPMPEITSVPRNSSLTLWKAQRNAGCVTRALTALTPVLALVLACAPQATPSAPPAVAAPEPVPVETPVAETVVEQKIPAVTILSDVGIKTSESVHFDRKRDVYFVSNINGSPTDVDNNGFISKLTPQDNGQFKIDIKFIEAQKNGVTLNAPKGLTVSGDILYVADIDRVRKFDAESGEALGEIVFDGATFLNDLATGADGSIYVSDSGLTPSFTSSGSDAVYRLSTKDKVKKLISGVKLGGPNGLLATEGGVWVTTFGSGELYWVSDKGEKTSVQKLPQGQNDGLVFSSSGNLLISSWEGSNVLSAKPTEEFKVAISGLNAPADIGYDCTRNSLLIPLFNEDKVVIHRFDN